jgi:hypothetical protein
MDDEYDGLVHAIASALDKEMGLILANMLLVSFVLKLIRASIQYAR